MIDISLMSKEEKFIIIGLLLGILIVLGIMFESTGGKRQQPSAPANVLSSGGSTGTGMGQFKMPRDVAVDKDGNIYIVDSLNNRIQKFNSAGVFVLAFGKPGDKEGELKEPCGIAIGPDGNIYVADTWNTKSRVQVFNDAGGFVRMFGAEQGMWGPRALTLDKDGNVYVSDTGNCKIVKFDKTGKYVASFGKKGEGALEFQEPFGLAVGPDNNLYVLDRKNFRVQVLSLDGKYLREFKVDGWTKEQFNKDGTAMEPYIAINQAKGWAYITDSTNHRVLRYTLDGKKKKIFAQDKAGLNMFGCPLGIAVGEDGKIYVTDSSYSKLITFTDEEK